jgi:hypothetical protein
MKTIKASVLITMLMALGGCMVVPVSPGPQRYYAPAYVGPSVGIGIYGGVHGGYGRGHWRH